MSKTPKAGTPAIVHVVARTNAQGRVAFSHRWHWQGQNLEHKGRINLPLRGRGDDATPIHFHFKDDTRPSRKLVFAAAGDGPIWVRRSGCPAANQASSDPQIPQNKIERSPHLLKVVDKNTDACTLHYRLRFTDRAGRHVSYDPDIKNGGTNTN